jgi:hypothetical protein
MEIIVNIKDVNKFAICYTTIFDEHCAKNLLSIFGSEKAVTIILEGKKYDSKFHILERCENLICSIDFHPENGILMKAFDFSETKIESVDLFQTFLKTNGISKFEKVIEEIIKKPSEKLSIKMICAEDYFLNRFQL